MKNHTEITGGILNINEQAFEIRFEQAEPFGDKMKGSLISTSAPVMPRSTVHVHGKGETRDTCQGFDCRVCQTMSQVYLNDC